MFAIAFIFNFIWENLHSFLYDNYRGGPITAFILLRAILADAVMITVIVAPFVYFSSLRKYRWLILIIGIALAIIIERYALSTGRWAYNEYMPLIPFLGVGLTPTTQLALLGYFSVMLEERMRFLYNKRP